VNAVASTRPAKFPLVILGILIVVVNISQVFTSVIYGWITAAIFAGVLVLIARWLGLSMADLGLSIQTVSRGLLWGGICILIIAAVLLIVYAFDANVFLDRRYDYSLWRAVAYAFIFVPLHTVFVEELAFRGVLWGAIRRKWGAVQATIISSIIFGLWHIVSSLDLSSFHGSSQIFTVIGTVIVTSLAGVGFCELRRRSDSLIAPILAHWGINGAAVIFAALAWAK
jgi:membrane protease YdiL (CAAX protease family)